WKKERLNIHLLCVTKCCIAAISLTLEDHRVLRITRVTPDSGTAASPVTPTPKMCSSTHKWTRLNLFLECGKGTSPLPLQTANLGRECGEFEIEIVPQDLLQRFL